MTFCVSFFHFSLFFFQVVVGFLVGLYFVLGIVGGDASPYLWSCLAMPLPTSQFFFKKKTFQFKFPFPILINTSRQVRYM